MRIASLSPEIRVDAMCDHVCEIPKGSAFGVAMGIRSVTWRSARSEEVIVKYFGAEAWLCTWHTVGACDKSYRT